MGNNVSTLVVTVSLLQRLNNRTSLLLQDVFYCPVEML
jgi:hypothetical protein